MPRISVLVVLTLLLAAAPAWPQEARSLYWSDMTVRAQLDADGRLRVVERQSMVFDGAWNGGERRFDLRHGQQLRLERISRVDPETGSLTNLVPGDLEAVDEYEWEGGNRLRWRSRLESAPPFESEQIVYELEYTLWPVLEVQDDGFLLRHDFAFADRDGVIESLNVELVLDPVWDSAEDSPITGSAENLPRGRGYVIAVPMEYAGVGSPDGVPGGAWWVPRLAAGFTGLVVPLLVLLGLLRRGRELNAEAPFVSTDEVDEDWLRLHIFAHPPELVGAAWDRSIGEPEVAALLARLVGEGKLESWLGNEEEEGVLHLRRVSPLEDFEPHERKLLKSLFFTGGDETDTLSIREHYKSKGFDPAAKIRKELKRRMKSLPGAGRRRRQLLPGLAAVGLGIACALLLPDRSGRLLVAVIALIVALVICAIAASFAIALSRRVTGRGSAVAGAVATMAVGGVLLALLASGAFERPGLLVFYRPGTWLLIGLAIVFAGIGSLTVALSRSTETPERLAFRRRLASARRYFEEQLGRAEPRLQDAWFPYLLAFGLGPHIDQWFRSFWEPSSDTGARNAGMIAAATAGSTSGTNGWSGGGPQFGGGSWGGGGAGGTWSAAAAGLAAGVSPPGSSGSGGGGAASSGGGGGGGW